MDKGTCGFICPTCGFSAVAYNDRIIPVTAHVGPLTMKAMGWSRKVRTYVHIDGTEHQITIGVSIG